MRISDWSSDVCSSDLSRSDRRQGLAMGGGARRPDARARASGDARGDQGRPEARRYGSDPPVAPVGRARDARRMEAYIEEVGKARGLNSLTGRAVLSADRSEEHTSELQSLMRISYAVFCLKKKKKHIKSHSRN